MTDEEDRAKEYRRQAQAREDWKKQNELVTLMPSPEHREQLQEEWDPLIPDTGWDPVTYVLSPEEDEDDSGRLRSHTV